MRDYNALFRRGIRYAWASGSQCVTEIVDAGVLNLATGRLMVADPGWVIDPLEESDAAAAIVPPGRYPVSLLVASWVQTPESGLHPMKKVCAARMRVSDDEVVEWRPAFQSAADVGEVGEPLGVAVDSGTASFFDFSAQDWLAEYLGDDDHWKTVADQLRRDLYVSLEDRRTAANAVIYECGMGDGVYEVWLGLNRVGVVSEVIMDLELLSHSTRIVD